MSYWSLSPFVVFLASSTICLCSSVAFLTVSAFLLLAASIASLYFSSALSFNFFIAVKDTAYDFNQPKSVENALQQLKNENGGIEFDDAYEVNPSATTPIAMIGDTDGKRQIKLYSDRNGLVIYTANPFDPDKEAAHEYNALATEAQTLPDAINHSDFGDVILRPSQPITNTIRYQYERLG
ncbi:hypothetical protein ODR38_06430 [Pediococcus acidilactici]